MRKKIDFENCIALLLILAVLALCVFGTYLTLHEERTTPASGKETDLPSVAEYLREGLRVTEGCLYVWGGGWNGSVASVDAVTYGPNPLWKELFDAADGGYNYSDNLNASHDGLDCTGFVGYTAYQVFGDKYAKLGYVFQSGTVGMFCEKYFGGEHIESSQLTRRCAGDVMYKNGHAWICMGECRDGSVLILHASPPNVTLSGTPTPDGDYNSEAIALAKKYMQIIAPAAYEKFPFNCERGSDYITAYNAYRFPDDVMCDPEGLRNMYADEVMKTLVGE